MQSKAEKMSCSILESSYSMQKQCKKVESNFTLENWACLSLKAMLLKDCLECEFKPTEPFEIVDVPSSFLPSLLFFTPVDETFLGFKGFSLLLLP